MGSIYSSCPFDFFGLALALLTLRSSTFLVLRFFVKRAMSRESVLWGHRRFCYVVCGVRIYAPGVPALGWTR